MLDLIGYSFRTLNIENEVAIKDSFMVAYVEEVLGQKNVLNATNRICMILAVKYET